MLVPYGLEGVYWMFGVRDSFAFELFSGPIT